MANTEHIFQIAVSVDDEAIKERAIKHCAEEITKTLEDGFFSTSAYGYNRGKREIGSKLQDVIKSVVNDFVEKHKDTIIKIVASDVADRMIRTKKIKELMEKYVEKEFEEKDEHRVD